MCIRDSNQNIDYVENIWVIQLHKALSDMGGKLLIQQLDSGILQRINDKYIMDAIVMRNFSLSSLRRINYCRIYLRVERISDIATNDGLRIQSRYFLGLSGIHIRISYGHIRNVRLCSHGKNGERQF